MAKNKKVMSMAIRPEYHAEMSKLAKRKGISVSAWIGNLIEQALKLNPDDDAMVIGKPCDEDVVPVVLKIPAPLKNHPDKLKQWMDVQVTGIVKAMTKHLNAPPDNQP